MFHQIVNRLGADFGGVTAWALTQATDGMSHEDALELLERLARIYDAVCPPVTATGDDE